MFTETIVNEEHYLQFLDIIRIQREKKEILLDLRPKTERDYTFVGIKNKMKTKNFEVSRIRKFVEKKLLLRLQ